MIVTPKKIAEGQWLKDRGFSADERVAILGHDLSGSDAPVYINMEPREPKAALERLRRKASHNTDLFIRAQELAPVIGVDPIALFCRFVSKIK